MPSNDIRTLVAKISQEILNPLIVLLFAIALVVFLWGLLVFIIKADSDVERATGRQQMLWGIIGMVIMASVFTIIRIIINTFGITTPTGAPF